MKSSLVVEAIGGPTLLIEMGGLRLLTDPTFDPPGSYPVGQRTLTKTAPPAIDRYAVGRIDVVLLSHDQHADNLDHVGRELLAQVPLVLTTPVAAARLLDVRGLVPWQEISLGRPDGSMLDVVAVPAQHGPDGTEHLTGPVTGFVLSADDLATVYISGDNASLDVVDTIVERFPNPDVAVIFAGAAQTALLGDAYLTLTSVQAAEAARRLGARWVVPAHFNSWSHYSEGADQINAAFGRPPLPIAWCCSHRENASSCHRAPDRSVSSPCQERCEMGGVEVLVDASDLPAADRGHEACGYRDGVASRCGGPQDVLLDEPGLGRLPADLVVAQVAEVGHDPSEGLQVCVAVLDQAVGVVPDLELWRVQVADGVDVAGFDGGEEPFGHP